MILDFDLDLLQAAARLDENAWDVLTDTRRGKNGRLGLAGRLTGDTRTSADADGSAVRP